jgi:alkaline phosphatase D
MRWTGLTSTAFVLLTVSPSGLTPATPTASPARTGMLVTVAEVSDTGASLWVRADGPGPVKARLRVEGDRRATDATIPLAADADGTGRVRLTGLQPRTRYSYEVRQDMETATGTFRTAPAPHTDVPARIVWSGDLGGANHCRDVEDGYTVFNAMTGRDADLFLFLGDTVYADQMCGSTLHAPGANFIADTLPGFHAKHRYNRADAALQRFFRTTPVFAVWDDHEVRNNFGPLDPLMPLGRRAFLDYWPIAGPPEEPTRLYRRVRWGRHAEIFILDTRQYRSANGDPDGPHKTMLGAAQRAWLLDGLERSDATWKLVASTVPLGMFTGGASSDSWAGVNVLGFQRTRDGFVHERDAILDRIRARGIENVVVLSGDVHHAELIRHEPTPGFVLHEFVAGPLAARQGFRRFLDRSLHSRSLGSLGWARNFGELAIERDTLTVGIVDAAGATRVRLELPAVHSFHGESP